MASLRSILFVVGSAGGFILSAVMLEQGITDRQGLPLAPVPKTFDQLAAGDTARWIELADAVPLCELEHDVGGNGAVPVVARAHVGAPTSVVLLGLRESEFCPTLSSPLRIAPEGPGYASRVLSEMRPTLPDGVVIARDRVFKTALDPFRDASINIVVWSVLCVLCLGVLGALIRRWFGSSASRMRAAGTTVAAPVDGVIESLVRGSAVAPSDSLLPPAPLTLTANAASMVWRRTWLAPALLIACGIGFGCLSVSGTLGIVNDLRAWYGGVEVPAQIKGKISTKIIASIVDVTLLYQLPDEQQLRTSDRFFVTLWMAGQDAGQVRALPQEPTVVTFEEAVDLVPLRAVLIVVGFALVVGCAVSARNGRRKARIPEVVARTAVEGRLEQPQVTETRVNGTVTNYKLSGLLNGRPASVDLTAHENPSNIVVADHSGALVVVVSGDGAHFVPLFNSGEPFLLSTAERVKAQAILAARASKPNSSSKSEVNSAARQRGQTRY